ncbi:hypothetical protein EHQ53_15595 [Leptospira langatensis]|uniref:Lipoprotein n=1 Tax=Leptospira langatensis TaxID=2484983 RepID=A0A5F1ZQ78_9LEPT|nr:hypothetical protein [Leptospira langatensis]TGK01888.1 hypothetical protein EHO57_08835 [Leptospira langatensis]TGL39493.1 hypothetical protein EHQ53_15595 [Leptospira langatensis]
MKSRIYGLVLSLFLALLLSGCATSSAGLATSTIPMADKKYRVIAPVEGMKYWFTFDIAIIGVPLGEPPIDRLLDELKKEKEADALINVRYWTDKIIVAFVTVNRLHISAEAVKFEEELPQPDPRRKGR